MLATLELKNLIDGKGFGEISEVYANNLPKEVQENTDKTIVLLRESDTFLGMFGNGRFHSKSNQIEVMIFYKLDLDFDPDDFETQLMQWLISNHYKITNIREHSIDPDTYQLTGVFYVEREQILKGE